MSSRKEERIIHRIMGAENELSSPAQDTDDEKISSLVLKMAVSKNNRRRLFNFNSHANPSFISKAILLNQGIIYIDGAHVEYSTPECLGPMELALFESAGLKIMTQIMRRFKRNTHQRLDLYKTNRNCSSDLDAYQRPVLNNDSWGSHANYLVKKSAFGRTNFFDLIMPFLISRWCLIGNGWMKINKTDGSLQFILSQRAEVMEKDQNSRRSFFSQKSASYGNNIQWRRHHDVSGNSTTSEWQLFLKYATFDIILAMAEEKFLKSPPETFPNDLFETSLFFNANPRSRTPVSLMEEDLHWNALDFQRFYLEQAQKFFAGPGKEALSQERRIALKLWEDILDAIAHWNLPYLAQFLDWAAILHYFLMPYLKSQGFDPEAILPDHEMRPAGKIPTASNKEILRDILDFMENYAFMDVAQSHYGEYLHAGLMKKLFPEKLVLWAAENPPERTRANWREKMLQLILSYEIDRKYLVNSGWDEFSFEFKNSKDSTKIINIRNPNPYRYAISAKDREKMRDLHKFFLKNNLTAGHKTINTTNIQEYDNSG